MLIAREQLSPWKKLFKREEKNLSVKGSIFLRKKDIIKVFTSPKAVNFTPLLTTFMYSRFRGYEGSAKITYSGNFSFEKVAKRLNLVTDYADFMEIQNAALSANGQAPRFSQTSIDAWRNDNGANPTVYPNTDWQDHIYRGWSPTVMFVHMPTRHGSPPSPWKEKLPFHPTR